MLPDKGDRASADGDRYAASKAVVRGEAERWLLTPRRIRRESHHRTPASATDADTPIRQDRGNARRRSPST
jgi:hypothetical protein